ncbi:MAG: helix-turn-helix transcriptional regulator [Lachnospiraceae bacterium]|jgi:transcriptional regulator with XRE-family HTH domain|nr:helix-turn-helix transcriptional regulator [Lachnospiraceae bacterium]
MNSIGEQIRYLRKEILNKTQKEFGIQIGLKPNSVSDIESGKNKPTKQTIKSICREFNINEEWLRTGTGEMKGDNNLEERFLSNISNLKHTDDETIVRWVNAVAETNPAVLREIEKFMRKVIGIEEDARFFESASLERTIDKKVEAFRCELEAEEKKVEEKYGA